MAERKAPDEAGVVELALALAHEHDAMEKAYNAVRLYSSGHRAAVTYWNRLAAIATAKLSALPNRGLTIPDELRELSEKEAEALRKVRDSGTGSKALNEWVNTHGEFVRATTDFIRQALTSTPASSPDLGERETNDLLTLRNRIDKELARRGVVTGKDGASSPPVITEEMVESEDEDPCPGGEHCCCCGPGEPCCDCGRVMPSRSCIGEKCWCGAPAAKKVGEEIAFDDPTPNRHNLTSYVCAEHYAQLMGPLGAQQVGLTAALASPKEGRK